MLSRDDAVVSVVDPWRYGNAGRLASIPGHITSLTYNQRGQVVEAVYANGVKTTNTYNDARGWLMRVVTAQGATVVQDVAYVRAATGFISTVTSAGRPNDSWTYYDDDLDRLVYAANAGGVGLDQAFSYNSAHNMVSNSAVGAYTYACASRMRRPRLVRMR
jgi:YD repeat-containing protein